MKNKEAILKVFFWRFLISIPLSTIVTYMYYGHIFKAVTFVIIMNTIMTIVHFIFEKIWPMFFKKIFIPN